MSWVELWNDIEAHYFTSSFGEYFGTLPVPLKRGHDAETQNKKEAQEFCPGGGKSERIWSHLPNMHALESEVEHACSEEDPASDKQLSKYE